MEKVITVPSRVADVAGLLHDLKKADFSVVNVGADLERTYVYLESHEEKDPAPLVLEWVGKEPPSRKEMLVRAIRMKAEMDSIGAKREEARAEAEAAAAAVAEQTVQDPTLVGTAMADPMPPDRPSILRRIFRKLW